MLKYDEEYKSKKFHVHNICPHYTKLRIVLPLGEGQRIEIHVMVKRILAKSKMFYFFFEQCLETNLTK